MSEKTNRIPSEGINGFDWTAYEDGWDGKSYSMYNGAYINDGNNAPYSHDDYVKESKDAYLGKPIPKTKELKKDALVHITDFVMYDDNTVLASINGGSNNVVIDLGKENKFFNVFKAGEKHLTKEGFISCITNPEMKEQFITQDFVAKVGTDTEKASMWEGHVENMANRMLESIHTNEVAYTAQIIASNAGGFVCMIGDTIQAFMPRSVASANRLKEEEYEALIGKSMDVMVENYDPRNGFVVSRKKYLHAIKPIILESFKEEVKKDQDCLYHGHVTDSTQYGIFVELDGHEGCLTGMIHKTLMSDGLRADLRRRNVKPGQDIDVYVHRFDKGNIILSDVPSNERDSVIRRREEEDQHEKNSYMTTRRDGQYNRQEGSYHRQERGSFEGRQRSFSRDANTNDKK